MTTARLLPIINAAGCVLLVGLVVVQWHGGAVLAKKVHNVEVKLINEENARLNAEFENEKLRKDIDGLKASIDSIRKDSEEHEKELAARTAELTTLDATLVDAQNKVKEWEEALKARDEAIVLGDSKIKELNNSLVATRKRLDEAVAQLKKAGARWRAAPFHQGWESTCPSAPSRLEHS